MVPGGTEAQPGGDDLAALEHAISTLEAQRGVLGDAVVDTALAPLQERRSLLLHRSEGEQRRLVTVVFADLVGFTDLSSWLDAEHTRTIVNAYFTRWRRVIEQHGGVVEKFIGDAVMAVFGLRQSWEDDAQRAVRSALAMVTELAELNEELERRYQLRLRMRVGVDTGDVVVSTLGDRGDTEFVVVGQSVNRASRLESAAPPDGILISADTHRQIRGRFSMERREGLVLKGIDEPVVAFLVVSERPHVFQLDRSRGVEGVETTTVGRDIELRFLQERLWDVVEEGHWRVVTVVGDAGVGKSRLLVDFDSWLAERPEPVWWFRGRASHTGQHRANALLRDLVGSRFSVSESDTADQVRSKLEAGFASGLEAGSEEHAAARRTAHLVGSWLSFDLGDQADGDDVPREPQLLRDLATEALAGYLARLGARAPVVVLLEDLHWADDGSLRWLDAAAPLLADARLLVVATARPALIDDRPHWGEGLAHHVRLPLDALSRRESRLLLQQILQRLPDPPPELLDLVITSAEGNPFYIEELVTWLIDAGVVVKDEPAWRVENDLVGSVVVPSTLRGVLQARLDALSSEERGLLQRASVVGRVFWDDAVQHLSAPAEDGAVTPTLDELRRRELIFERELSSFDSSREFLFKHALLRDVAYDGVLRTHRQRYHARAATWLAEVCGRSGREDEYAALIAEHHDRAGDPAAGPWYFRAGRQALSVYALAEGAALLRRALDLVTDDPAQRFDILEVREAMLDRIGDRAGQQLDLTEMGELAARTHDPRRLAHHQLACSRLAFVLSHYDDAEVWAEQAAETADAAGLLAEAAEARLWLGKSLTWHDEADAARAALTAALEEARTAGQTALAAESLRYLSILVNNEGDFTGALDLVEQAREAFASIGDLEGEGTALGQQATTLFHLGRRQEARETLERVLPLFRRSGHRYRVGLVLGNLGTIAMTRGELAAARRWSTEAVAVMRELNDREAASTNLTVLGVVATAVGDYAEAGSCLREALEVARDVETTAGETDVLAKQVFLDLDRGEVEQARATAEEAQESAEVAMSALERGHARLAAGYAELAAAEHETAERHFVAAQDLYSSIDVTEMAVESQVGRAAVALEQGRVADAVLLVEEVLDLVHQDDLEGMNRPVVVLDTCARVLRVGGHPRAEELLSRAQAVLRSIAERIGDPQLAAAFLAKPLNAALLDGHTSG